VNYDSHFPANAWTAIAVHAFAV